MITILLADDERIVRNTMSSFLSEAGYDVIVVSDGESAVASFRQKKPDLVLLDVMMPRMDGFAACAEIRKTDMDTPVILFTGADTEANEIKGLEVGADDFISKASSDQVLLLRISKALARSNCKSSNAIPGNLTKAERDIFRTLSGSIGRFFSYRELADAIAGEGYRMMDGAIRTQISRLRAKLDGRYEILVRRGVGYSLVKSGNL